MSRRVLFACAVLSAIAAIAPAHAASFLEKNFYLRGPQYSGALPGCESALARITEDFAYTQQHFWALPATIVGFERVREVAYSPWALGTIPHRYCEATALVQDPRFPQVAYKKHKVRYRIGEDTGFASIGSGVEWCVSGYDWNWAYTPACRMAGP
jgi:hypothetical protein